MQNVLSITNRSFNKWKDNQKPNDYRQSKILPHITKQFDFRITNRLLIQKIITPRRDKTIINSLNNTSHSLFHKNKISFQTRQSITYRRKIIKHKTNQNTHQSNILLRNACKRKQGKNQQKIEGQNLYHDFLQEKQDLVQSKWMESKRIQESNQQRKNWIGKIIQNHQKFQLNSTKRTDQCNHLQNNQSAVSLLIGETKAEGRVAITKSGSCLIRKNYGLLLNKQNRCILNDN